nr:TonB-dependent receptor [Saprospiraceae bacterium]
DFSGGSFNTRRASLNFNSGLSSNGYFAEGRVSRIKSDGYIDRATADLTSFFAGVGKVGDRSSIRLNLLHGEEITYQAWNGVPADFLDDPDLRTFNSAGMNRPDKPHPNEVDDYQQTHLQFFYNYSHSDRWESGLTLHYTKGKGFFEQYRSNDRYSSYGLDPVTIGNEEISRTDLIRRRWLDNDFYGVILNTHYNLNPFTKLSFGGGWNHYIGDHFGEVIWARLAPQIENDYRYYENDADKYDFNAFVKAEHRMGDFLVWGDLQFRSVDYRFLGFDRLLENVDQEQNLSFFNPKAGLTWLINDRTNIYGSLAISNREPNRRDFTESSPNSRPQSEKMFNVETGFRSSGQSYSFQANVYYMGYRDQLVPTGQINDVGSIVRENVDESYRVGLELIGGYSILSNLEIFANLTWSENRIENYEFFLDEYDADFNFTGQVLEFYESTPMALSPEQIVGVGINWTPLRWSTANQEGRVEVDLFSQYVSRQYLDNTGNRDNSLDPFHYTDLNFSMFLDQEKWPGLALNFAVRNITDQKYETNGWSYSYVFDDTRVIDQGFYPQAGRNFLVGLSLSFK